MLVHFPIALFITGLLALIAYMTIGDVFWYRAATIALIAGSAMAVLAAIVGMFDLFKAIPAGTPARRTGILHMGFNLLAVVLFLGAGLVMWTSFDAHVQQPLSELNVMAPLVLAIVGSVALGIGGALGSKLVYKEHVGQDLQTPIEAEPMATGMPARRPL